MKVLVLILVLDKKMEERVKEGESLAWLGLDWVVEMDGFGLIVGRCGPGGR